MPDGSTFTRQASVWGSKPREHIDALAGLAHGPDLRFARGGLQTAWANYRLAQRYERKGWAFLNTGPLETYRMAVRNAVSRLRAVERQIIERWA